MKKNNGFVSVEVYKQVAWERDIAVAQLRELGYELGEKIIHENLTSKEKFSIQKEGRMTKGFLLLDQSMNTIIIPFDDPDLAEFFRRRDDYRKAMDKAHQHGTLKELDSDVRKYLKGEYDG